MIYGMLGEKLPHSFSKVLHEKLGLYRFDLLEVAKDDLDRFMTEKPFDGINVTIPYKQAVIPYLDEISQRAEKIGAVNTIVKKNGKLYGENTDFLGMTALIKKAGVSIKGKKVLILGTGGTSKTAYAVAESMEASFIRKVSRTGNEGALTYQEAYKDHSDAEIIINTTPCGMYPDVYKTPIDIEAFGNLQGVIDAVYNPLHSLLVQKASERGIPAQGGLYMMVSQVVPVAEIFTGKELPKDLTEGIFKELYNEKRNIVLAFENETDLNMIALCLSEKTGNSILDLDSMKKTDEKAIDKVAVENKKIIYLKADDANEDDIKKLKLNGTLVFIKNNKKCHLYEKYADALINYESDVEKTVSEICHILDLG